LIASITSLRGFRGCRDGKREREDEDDRTEVTMSESKTTTNHDEIRRWVEERGGRPARVLSKLVSR
jgi:hypothetical protein